MLQELNKPCSMQIRNLLQDDDAVSPVIGVILMVAITVILAAVIAAFVLGLGDSSEVGPSVSFSYDYTGENVAGPGDGVLVITVSSGDEFSAENVAFQGEVPQAGDNWYEHANNPSVGPGSSVTAGDRATLENLTDEFELDIVWTSDDGSDSSIISTRNGPDA